MLPARLGVPRLLRCRVVESCEHREGAPWKRCGCAFCGCAGPGTVSVVTQGWVFCQKWSLVQYFCMKSAVKAALSHSSVGLSEVGKWSPVLCEGIISTGTHSKSTLGNPGVKTDTKLRHTSCAELSLMLVLRALSFALTMGAGF